MKLSVDSRLSQILEQERGRDIFECFLPGMLDKVQEQPAIKGFTVRKLVSYAQGAISESVLEQMDKALQTVEVLDTFGYTQEQPLTLKAAETVQEEKHTAIRPGSVWRDTNGVRIQAHGGAVFYEDGVYYWYGENKDRTDGKCPVWTWGIRAYASKDLYNWEDLGLIIEPDLMNPESGLYPEKHADRPHILKCESTGRYVCWIKQCGDEACFMILSSEAFTGPYSVEKETYRPLGMKVGDFDLIRDEDTGRSYLYMDADHAGIVCMELTVDFLSVEREVSRQYEGLHAPFCREAPALFECRGKKYMLTSGMTGYIPNKSDYAVSESWEKPFASVGNPHRNDKSNASFNSQISKIFKVEGKEDLYIAMADRWVPEFVVDARIADIMERSIAGHYEPDRYQVTPQEQELVMQSPMLESADTSGADYVWLPIHFEKDQLVIEWMDEWRIEDYG